MKKLIKPIGTAFIIGVMVFCFGMTLVENPSHQTERKVQVFHKEGNPLTGREAIDILEKENEQEEPLNVGLWGEVRGETLKFEEFNREVIADLIVISGDSSLLFFSRYSLGKEVYDEILLSRDVAHSLFGNTLATDILILHNGQEYIFRGVLENVENTAVIQASRQTPRVLDAAVIEIPGGRGQVSVVREFETRFWQVERVFDVMLLRAIGNIFTAFLPIVVGSVLLFKGIKQSIVYKKVPAKCLAWLGLTGIILISFWWLNQDLPRVELGFAPTMWSDFNYWRSFFTGITDTMRAMLGEYWRQPERIVFGSTWRLIQYGIFATGLFLIFVRKVVVESWVLILFYSGSSFFATFLVISNNGRNDFRGVWSLWWLVFFYLIAKKLMEVNLDKAKEDKKIRIVFED